MTNEIALLEKEKIENLIYEVRGKMVMLDSEMSATKWHEIKYLIYLNLKVIIKPILFYQF